MVRLHPLLLLLVPCLAFGGTIVVNTAKDTPGSIKGCPGAACNLRSAMATAQWNDTILLSVSPVMDEFLFDFPAPRGYNENGTLYLTAKPQGLKKPPITISPSKANIGFLRTQTWPFTAPTGFLTLEVSNIEFTKFNWVSSDKSQRQAQGLLFCLDVGDGVTNNCLNKTKPSPDSPLTHSPPEYAPQGHLLESFADSHSPLPARRGVGAGAGLGIKNPILRLVDCVFSLNNVDTANFDTVASSFITVSCSLSFDDCPMEVVGTRFFGNKASGVQGVGTVIDNLGYIFHAGDLGNGRVPLSISSSQFIDNQNDAIFKGPFANAGSIVSNDGDIFIQGSVFTGNKLGSVRAVVETNDVVGPRHLTIIGSSFTDNGANPGVRKATSVVPATVRGGWVVLQGSSIRIPNSCPATATYSPNDQYLIETAITAESKVPAQLAGYQIFNMNTPTTNLANGTSTTLGFANCAEAKGWLPCPSGTTCMNAKDSSGMVVGYRCE